MLRNINNRLKSNPSFRGQEDGADQVENEQVSMVSTWTDFPAENN